MKDWLIIAYVAIIIFMPFIVIGVVKCLELL